MITVPYYIGNKLHVFRHTLWYFKNNEAYLKVCDFIGDTANAWVYVIYYSNTLRLQ